MHSRRLRRYQLHIGGDGAKLADDQPVADEVEKVSVDALIQAFNDILNLRKQS
jgi:hypothetical protein